MLGRTIRRKNGSILIILGAVLSLISGIGAYIVIATAQPTQAEVTRTPVVIAVQPISGRTEITADQLAVINWPVLSDFPLPPGTYTDLKDVVGKLSLEAIGQGQPIISSAIVDKSGVKGKLSNASFILDKGTVAVTLPLNPVSSVADAIQPGDRVDILATFSAPGVNERDATATQKTLENLLVLQVGLWSSSTDTSRSQQASNLLVTLQVSEQEALVVKYIETKSTQWTLVLRPVDDTEASRTAPVTFEYMNKAFGYQFPASTAK